MTLCDPTDYSPPGSSAHWISQARIPEWVAISYFKGSSRPRDQTCISCLLRWEADSYRRASLGGPYAVYFTVGKSLSLVTHSAILSVSGYALGHVGPYFPDQGLNPHPPALQAQSLNHWTTRKVPHQMFNKPLPCGRNGPKCFSYNNLFTRQLLLLPCSLHY